MGFGKMERLKAFEEMLEAIVKQANDEKKQMDAMKSAGKEKTATYRQYFGNRLVYNQMLSLYKKYGLID